MSLLHPSRRTLLAMLAGGAALPMLGTGALASKPGGRPTIMIIRHAEKPVGDGTPYGITEDGTQSLHALTPRGWTRAGALAELFAPSNTLMRRGLVRPETLFASLPNSRNKSLRPSETLTPLSAKMGLPINGAFGLGDESALAKAVLETGGNVLIAWQHEAILKICAALGFGGLGLPAKWPGDRFDIVFVFAAHTDGWRFTQVPQLLLSGDRAQTIT